MQTVRRVNARTTKYWCVMCNSIHKMQAKENFRLAGISVIRSIAPAFNHKTIELKNSGIGLNRFISLFSFCVSLSHHAPSRRYSTRSLLLLCDVISNLEVWTMFGDEPIFRIMPFGFSVFPFHSSKRFYYFVVCVCVWATWYPIEKYAQTQWHNDVSFHTCNMPHMWACAWVEGIDIDDERM